MKEETVRVGDMPEMARQVALARGWLVAGSAAILDVPGGRTQAIQISLERRRDGQSILRLVTFVGRAEKIDGARALAALALNSRLAHGAFAIAQDRFCLLDLLEAETVTEASLAASIEYMAATADRCEALLFGKDEH